MGEMGKLILTVWRHDSPGNEDEPPELSVFKVFGEVECSWYEEGLSDPGSGIMAKIAEAVPEANKAYKVAIHPFWDPGEEGCWDCDVIFVWEYGKRIKKENKGLK